MFSQLKNGYSITLAFDQFNKMMKIKKIVKRYFNKRKKTLDVVWHKQQNDCGLHRFLGLTNVSPSRNKFTPLIESLADAADNLGPQKLWDGYGKNNRAGPNRDADEVRTGFMMGNLFSNLVTQMQSEVIVEVGTAFGVSGMYFLSGIELIGKGMLYTFDPNESWSDIARANLNKISDRYVQTIDTFENTVDAVMKGKVIDVAFIDAIHTSEFVESQLELILKYSHSGTILLFDDIRFSEDMHDCWIKIANSSLVSASASVDERVGFAQLA